MSKRKGFIFTNKKHSPKAVMGTVLGIISLISMIAVIFLSYCRGGQAPIGYGFTGLFAAVFSVIGLALGIKSLQERDTFRLFPWLGTMLNALSLILIGLLLYVAA